MAKRVLQRALILRFNPGKVLARRLSGAITRKSGSLRGGCLTRIRFWHAQRERGRGYTRQNPGPARGWDQVRDGAGSIPPIQDTPPPITRSSPARSVRQGYIARRSSAQRQIECSVHVFNTCPRPCGPPPKDEHGRSRPYASQGCRGRRAMFRRRCPVLPQWHRTITSHGVPGNGRHMSTDVVTAKREP